MAGDEDEGQAEDPDDEWKRGGAVDHEPLLQGIAVGGPVDEDPGFGSMDRSRDRIERGGGVGADEHGPAAHRVENRPGGSGLLVEGADQRVRFEVRTLIEGRPEQFEPGGDKRRGGQHRHPA